MELVIEGLNKLVLKTFSGRKISDITVKNRTRKSIPQDTAYVFTIKELPKPHQSKPNAIGKCWEDEFEVWLSKFPNAYGKYELFVMGLHGVTCSYLDLKQIRDIDVFQCHFISTVDRAKTYWESL